MLIFCRDCRKGWKPEYAEMERKPTYVLSIKDLPGRKWRKETTVD